MLESPKVVHASGRACHTRLCVPVPDIIRFL